MFDKIANKLLTALLAIFILIIITFSLIHILPGDPALIILGDKASAEVLEEFRETNGLNDPLLIQFISFLKKILVLDLGTSLKTQVSLSSEIAKKFTATFELSLVSMLLAILLGIPLGLISAVKRNKTIDKIITVFSLSGISMPIFWLALLVIWFFSIYLNILPVSGRMNPILDLKSITGIYLLDSLLQGEFEVFNDCLSHIILPSICLATIPLATITRFSKAYFIDTLSKDYIRTAKAKGLSQFNIFLNHALKNISISILTIIILQFGTLLSGAIITESIFSWPGIGRWLLDSIFARDFPAIQAATLTIGTIFVITHLFADIIYKIIDPRLRKEK